MTKLTAAVISVFLFTQTLQAQVGYVEAENKVYFFLERMNASGLLENYDTYEKPKTRTEIVKHLLKLKTAKLNKTDREKLEYFLTEFSFEIEKHTKNYISPFKNLSEYFAGNKPKFLFFESDSSLGSVFINFIGKADYISKNSIENKGNSLPFIFGGKIRFTFGKYFGGKLQATNGGYFGNKQLLLEEAPFKYNYKFTESNANNSGADFFDETEGYFTAQTKHADFKIGRDRLNFGYGIRKTLFGFNPPRFDYVALNLRYKNFRFSFLHAKLLGTVRTIVFNGNSKRVLNDKWLAYHRFAYNITGGTQIGAGETVIYYGRSVDLSYLNPFNFYKSAEHANQDRDNSMLFFDFKTSDLLKRFEFYFTWMIDDMDFTKLGTDWYGNNFLWDFGFSYLPDILPADLLSTQIVLIDPYFYSHKFNDNSFTNLDFNLADDFEPNSFNVLVRYKFSITANSDFSFMYSYCKHGANELDDNGNLITNYGGNILQGYRREDSEYVKWLDGVPETRNSFAFRFRYEFIRNYNFIGKYLYSSENNLHALYAGLAVEM